MRTDSTRTNGMDKINEKMRKSINAQGLLKFADKFGESYLNQFDLSSIVLRTGGNDAMYMHHGSRGYGFVAGERQNLQGKKDYEDYDSINPWYGDLIAFMKRRRISDVLFVANQLGEDYASNKTVLNTFRHSSGINVYGTELSNEPYMKWTGWSFYEYYQKCRPYLDNQMYAPVGIAMENNGATKPWGYRFNAFADSGLDLVNEARTNELRPVFHIYFNPNKLTQELSAFSKYIEQVKLRTDKPIWVTETNIHESYLGSLSKDTLWDCWVEMYATFEALGIELVCHQNLASQGKYALINKHGPVTKSDGTPLINFFL